MANKNYIEAGDRFKDRDGIIWTLKRLFTLGYNKVHYGDLMNENGELKRITQMQIEFEHTEV